MSGVTYPTADRGRAPRTQRRRDAAAKSRRKKPKALRNLNREQQAAVTHPPAKILVIAGAGTGKTRVLTRRAAFLIEARDAQPEQVLAITLTNKAAREMIGRLRSLCGAGAAERIHAGTFTPPVRGPAKPSPAHRQDRAVPIYDEDDARRLVARTMTQQEAASIKPSVVRREISANKNHAVPVEQYTAVAADKTSRIVARVWSEYERELGAPMPWTSMNCCRGPSSCCAPTRTSVPATRRMAAHPRGRVPGHKSDAGAAAVGPGRA